MKRAIKGIVGMGGSGKTALARSIFHSENMKNHFELRLWIDFSEAIDEKKKYFCILVEKFDSGYIKSPCQYGLDEVLNIFYIRVRCHETCIHYFYEILTSYYETCYIYP